MSAFEARYHGRCAADCGSQVEPGDAVRYVDDELMHAGCADEPARDELSRGRSEPCPSCWLIHAGECA